MNFQPASAASMAAFLAIVVAIVVAFLGATWHAYDTRRDRRLRVFVLTSIATAAWLGGLILLVGSGALLRLPLAGLPFFFGAILLVTTAAGLSPLAGRLAATIPLAALVGFQAFRLPLELVLHAWAEQGTIPISMTWRGRNWDILTGFIALGTFPFAERSRMLAWIVNLFGAALLLNVMRVAVMSSPLPFAWGVTPPLLLALNLPYALIGPVCVGGALLGHLVLTRALLRKT